MTERDILRAIRLALGQRDDVVLWRNESGMADHGRHKVRYGLCVGSADLIGIVRTGRFLALEVKAARGRATKEQQQFLALVNNMGGYGVVVRSVAEAMAAADRAAKGDWTA